MKLRMDTLLTTLSQVYGCDYQMLAIQYFESADTVGPFSGAFFPPPADAPGACCTYSPLFCRSLPSEGSTFNTACGWYEEHPY